MHCRPRYLYLEGWCLLGALLLSDVFVADVDAATAKPLMIIPGERIVSKDFDHERDVDKASIRFRKETQYKINDGFLTVIPPVIAYSGTEKDSKWASSTMARAGLLDLPAEYICQFRWKYNKSANKRYKTKGSAFIDLGHRCIRTTFTRAGTTLKLENHLVGNDAAETSKLLVDKPELKLKPDKWYDITIEVKGDEVVIQIDGQVLHGQDKLIAKERHSTFNIDSGGDGYVLDNINAWAAGDYQANWEATKQTLR